MKEFNRASITDQISYNNREFHRIKGIERSGIMIGYCNSNNIQLVQLNVLARNLKGHEDAHGKPYKPSVFYLASPCLADWQLKELEELERKANNFHSEYNTGA